MRIEVRGLPAPQGSKRAFAVRGRGGVPTGRVAVIESSHDRVKSWRQAVLEQAVAAMNGGAAFTGPLTVRMSFYLPRPRGHYGTGRNADSLKPSAPVYPAKLPDLSKLVRSTEDALTDAGIWGDDGQVVMISTEKQYAGWRGCTPSAPGAVIEIEELR